MRMIALSVLALLAAAHLLMPISSLQAAWNEGIVDLLLVELRLPRTLLVVGYGAVLGISGAALQAMFSNPLASPDITGASSGAALGAVLGMYWLSLSQPLALAACGAAGALVALLLLFLLAGPRAESATLLLAGIALSLAAGAATSLALALAPSPFAFYDAFDWLMGSFVDRSLPQALVLLPAGIAAGWLLSKAKALDLLALGDDTAASIGVEPRRLATGTVLASAIAVGACVSVCGAIGFVGLVAPVLARAFLRGHPGRALGLSGAIGAALLTAADLASRAVPLDRAIPVGVITALFGTPLFFWLVVRMRRGIAA